MADKSERNQWLDVITRLIKLTQKGELEWWEAGNMSPNDSSRTTAVFIANYKGKLLRLYATKQGFEQSDLPVLEFITETGTSLWQFPDVDALSDLLSAVQYRVAKIPEFLADILEEEFVR